MLSCTAWVATACTVGVAAGPCIAGVGCDVAFDCARAGSVEVAAAPGRRVAEADLIAAGCLMKVAAASATMPITSKAIKEVVTTLIMRDSFMVIYVGGDGASIGS